MSSLKSERVNLRVAARDDALFRRAASVAEESLSEFLVESGRERAERLLADRSRFELSEEEWDVFVAALDRPAQPDARLVELFQRPRPS